MSGRSIDFARRAYVLRWARAIRGRGREFAGRHRVPSVFLKDHDGGSPTEPRYAQPVLEQVELTVREGREAAYEAAFEQAAPIVRRQVGCRSVRLVRSVQHPTRYVLLVQWRLESDHSIAFRQSEDYQTWRSLLHHFYEDVPPVDHWRDLHRS